MRQLDVPLSLSSPVQFVRDMTKLQAAHEYLFLEYGAEWVGTRAVESGAVVHHGDAEETREVLESLLRDEIVRLVFCTNTLAEGVDLTHPQRSSSTRWNVVGRMGPPRTCCPGKSRTLSGERGARARPLRAS